MTNSIILRLIFIQKRKRMKQILTLLLLSIALTSHAGEIVVDEGESIHDALIRGIGEKHTSVICGDARQRHTQVWPLKEQGDSLPIKKHDDGLPMKGMERMLDFNTTDRTITIPTPPQHILQIKNMEMVVHQRWAIAILRVKEMKVEGDKTVVSFMEPESRLEFEHPWPQPVIGGEKGNSSFLLRTTEQRDGIEQLVIVDGANYVRFEGITFKHTCWNRPLHKGHVTLQGGFPLIDAYKLKENPGLPWDKDLENQAWIERPVSAVTVRNAHHVDFHSVLFENLAATALDFVDNVSDCVVQKCTFGNIGGHGYHGRFFCRKPPRSTPSLHRPGQALSTTDHQGKLRCRCSQRRLGRRGHCIGLCTPLHHQQEPRVFPQLLGHLRRLGLDTPQHGYGAQLHRG